MKKYKIAQFGTFDVENFGDLLFPYVLQQNLSRKIDIEYIKLFSPIGGMMPFFNDVHVYPISEFENQHDIDKFDAIIIGGGDLIRFDYGISKDYFLNKTLAQTLWIEPILFAIKYDLPVMFNVPGVPFNINSKYENLMSLLLEHVDYISVRDNISKRFILNCNQNLNVNVLPDSVLTIAKCIDDEENEKTFKRVWNDDTNYIVVQINCQNENLLKELATQLIEISQVANCKIVLMPIGYVHDDIIGMEKLCDLLPNTLLLRNKLTPFEMISIISHSKFFIGTSLHGNVVARAYGINSIALNINNLTKINGFFELTDSEMNVLCDASKLSRVFYEQWKNKYKFDLDKQIKKIEMHFDNIANSIKSYKLHSKKSFDINELLLSEYISIDESKNNMCVYLNTGKGFNENEKLKKEIDNGFISLELDLPSNVKQIRFDPVENCFCILKNLEVTTNNGLINYKSINGTTIDNMEIFTNTDPQILIDFCDVSTNFLNIKCELHKYHTSEIAVLAKFCEMASTQQKLTTTLTNTQQELATTSTKLECVTDELATTSTKLECVMDELATVQSILDDTASELDSTNEQLEHYKMHYAAAINQRDELTNNLRDSQAAYLSIEHSTIWRMTKPIRVVLNGIKRVLRANKCTRLFCKGLLSIKRHGVKATWVKVKHKFNSRTDYSNFLSLHELTDDELSMQRAHKFDKDIKFSIITPLYNTPESFLHEMIESVVNQTYGNWELCLTNASDDKHNYVEKIVKSYMKKDKRILYKKLETNLGISENSNACIEMSTGDYIALLDHDDILMPNALFENMKAICEEHADFIYSDEATFENKISNIITFHFKPDFAIDNLRANNYICHFTVFNKHLLETCDWFDKKYNGSQDHDFVLRLTENTLKNFHISKILYLWRSHSNSVASDISNKLYAIDSGKRAVKSHIERCGLNAKVESSVAFPTIYKISYEIENNSLVSIIIPNKDHVYDLSKCINSIINKTTYDNFEILIIENNSIDEETFKYYREINDNDKIRVLNYKSEKGFNYSAINNFAVKYANGEHLLFLNNDTEIISPNWIEEMLMYSQRKDVGAVGAKLYYPNDTIQHAGIILKLGAHKCAGHCFHKTHKENLGYMGRLYYSQNLSAVTAACLMMRKDIFENVGGFDEGFAVAFNDVDLCMRIRKAGYLIVWTPYAELYHYESISRGYEDTPEKQNRFSSEVLKFQQRWAKELKQGDPYYNVNLTLDKEDFSVKKQNN